jgi:imidazole glycerol-phosphate synthase subunit HisH
MTLRVALVDTGHANLRSVQKALELAATELSGEVVVERTHDPDRVRELDKIVVPGQGGFGDCVRALRGGIDQVIVERVGQGVPYFGICLGLQALFESSEEAPGVVGLGLLPGHVKRLESAPGLKIPHMGWNELELASGGHPVIEAAGGQGAWFYFVHSFHAVPADPTVVKARAGYGPNAVTAAVAKDNILATQFHPEKSQAAGHKLLTAFLKA